MVQPFDAFLETWYHLCHTFSLHTYTIYLQGQEYVSGEILGEGGPLLTNGTLILGQEQDGVSQGFDPNQVLLGDLAQVNLWDRLVTPEEVKGMASCGSSNRGNVFSSDTAVLELFGDVSEKWVNVSYFCSSGPKYVMLPESRSITDARRQCHLSNASLALPTSESENQILVQVLERFQNVCSSTNVRKLWLGATDKEVEGKWRMDGSGNLMTYDKFYPPAPNGGTVGNCLVMRHDGAWEDDVCDERNKKCTSCYYQNSDYLRLRGLCFDNEHQQRFRVTGYMNGRPMYRGFYYLLIYWANNNTWYLTNARTNTTIASYSFSIAKHYPLGRLDWLLHTTICDLPEGDKIELSLSACPDDQYMCRDGECIASNRRCDLRTNCVDESDEENCNFVLLPKGYRQYLTPVSPGTGEKLSLVPHFSITRFDAIEDLSMTIALELKVSISWRDHRLTFRNLHDPERGSVISSTDRESIWLPQYDFENIYRGNIKMLEEVVVVNRSTNQSEANFNQVDMDTLHPGSESSLTHTKEFVAIFNCYFILYYYPFDSQFCEIRIRLSTHMRDHATFSMSQGVAEYLGVIDLPLYSVQYVALRKHTHDDVIFIDFVLKRRVGNAVLSIFVPTMLLLLVSWSTLFLKLEALNVRAIMSLTTLLVLYTMFANLSSSLPSTAEVKLIDVWFFFIIFLLFSNIMVHVFADQLQLHSPDNITKVSSFASPSSPSVGNLKKITPVRLLKFQRYVVLPLSFFIFTLNVVLDVALDVALDVTLDVALDVALDVVLDVVLDVALKVALNKK
ncbi:Gamma-aminobutyric acid receptor subunit beta-like 8 [Homarus americanus]|uniref:Gamma-aminobutyric acid receptor subunit beta-like 8 n=1 Tax=Homarus americanus TaxID=6706 RepID=A0A8J5N980_HOMAM|nr:Gamma-aminobutyric acid receptor subunit beta-like 8 [Homarus americanus]